MRERDYRYVAGTPLRWRDLLWIHLAFAGILAACTSAWTIAASSGIYLEESWAFPLAAFTIWVVMEIGRWSLTHRINTQWILVSLLGFVIGFAYGVYTWGLPI